MHLEERRGGRERRGHTRERVAGKEVGGVGTCSRGEEHVNTSSSLILEEPYEVNTIITSIYK